MQTKPKKPDPKKIEAVKSGRAKIVENNGTVVKQS